MWDGETREAEGVLLWAGAAMMNLTKEQRRGMACLVVGKGFLVAPVVYVGGGMELLIFAWVTCWFMLIALGATWLVSEQHKGSARGEGERPGVIGGGSAGRTRRRG